MSRINPMPGPETFGQKNVERPAQNFVGRITEDLFSGGIEIGDDLTEVRGDDRFVGNFDDLGETGLGIARRPLVGSPSRRFRGMGRASILRFGRQRGQGASGKIQQALAGGDLHQAAPEGNSAASVGRQNDARDHPNDFGSRL